MESVLLLATGLFLGVRHAFDPDHLVAVTHFVSAHPRPKRGALFGFWWGLGHTLTVLILGSVIIVTGLKLPPPFERYAEIAVGFTLIGLAAWRIWLLMAKPVHSHPHEHGGIVHDHPHSHEPGSDHAHAHVPTVVGMLHGAAGTVGVFALLPVSFIASPAMAVIYLLTFGLGTVLAMGAYGWLAGHVYGKVTAARWQRLFSLLVVATALTGFTLGIFWIGRNL